MRDYKREYQNYHASPKQKRNRAARNLWNRRLKGKVPAGKEIDHRHPLGNGGSNARSNIRYRSISANRADKSAVKTAMWESFRDELIKIAGDVDKDALNALGKKVRRGDIVNYMQHPADKTNLKDLAMTAGVSGPISKVTGSPYSHTAMISQVMPDGRIEIIDNFEGATGKGVRKAFLNDVADSTSFHVRRPRVAPYVSSAAADAAEAAIGNSSYSKADLLSMAPQEAARNLFGEKNKVTKAARGLTGLQSTARNVVQNCDPATGVCSFLPIHAYGEVMGGKQKATETLLGSGTKYVGKTTASPAMLQASDAMDEIFSYSPKNRNKSALKQGVKLLSEEGTSRLKKLFRRK
jgi:hypothetical protein